MQADVGVGALDLVELVAGAPYFLVGLDARVPNDLARVVLELLGQRERTRLAHAEHHRLEEPPYRLDTCIGFIIILTF
jgi:hypothetical protein